MKAKEAPEKIILSADRDTQIINDDWVINDYTDNIKIEYTRTDAFIEKAAKWLDETLRNTDFYENEIELMVEEFKKYMKGNKV